MGKTFPEESDKQKIGQMADAAFRAKYPCDSWRLTELAGGNDYGKDYWIQISDNGAMSHSFFLQLKGSEQVKDGKSKRLSKDGIYYSQELELTTLNKYYCEIYPVMIVFADLTQDTNPRNCNIYYRWIDEDELKNIIEDKASQSTCTFKIPVCNILNDDIDVLPYIKEFTDKHKSLNALWNNIPTDSSNKEKIDKVYALNRRISSNPTIFNSIIQDDDDPWINAQKGSIQFNLREISKNLDSYFWDIAQEQLNDITSEQLKNASDHEKAEYHYLKAKLSFITDNENISLENYKKAFDIFPNNDKYYIAYLENKLNYNYENTSIINEVIKELEQKESIKAKLIKAKALALLNNEESLSVLEQLPEKEILIMKPLCLLLLRRYKNCCNFVKSRLENTKDKNKFKLLLFLTRSLFILGFDKDESKANTFVSFAGMPDMDIPILQECWKYTKDIWNLTVKLGYPNDIEYITDISCILGMYFQDINEIYPIMISFADKYPRSQKFQDAMLAVSLALNDLKVAKRILQRVDLNNIHNIIYKIDYEYRLKNFDEVARSTYLHLDELSSKEIFGYDFHILRGIECAEKSFMFKEKEAFLKKIQQLPDSEGLLASYQFSEKINNSELNGKEALDELYSTFDKGCNHPQVLNLLISNLNPIEKDNYSKIQKVVQEIKKQRSLQKDEFYTYADAIIVAEEWEELLLESEKELVRYPNDFRLLSVKAFALDQKGDTPKALEILTYLLEQSVSDKFAIEVSLNVFLRCGFSEQAKALLTKILPQAIDNKKRLLLLRTLYRIEMQINSDSPLLVDYCFQYGKIANQKDIEEEGIFMQLAFLTIINPNIKIPNEKKNEFIKRRNEYSKQFPESEFMREIQIPVTANAQQMQEIIDNTTGGAERYKALKELESKIISGKLLIPFSIRHNYLPNICDLLHLWQITKHTSRKYTQYQLAFSEKTYKLKDINFILSKIPLIDEISLIMLNDLGLLPYLFEIFEKVIITKATISRLVNWGQRQISFNCDIALNIINILKSKITQIIQPTCKYGDGLHYDINDLIEYGNIFDKNTDCIFYSDDGLARYILYQDKYESNGMTTIDFLEILRFKGILSDVEIAKKYAKLGDWNITGVGIQYNDILRVISEETQPVESLEESIQALHNNDDFIYIIKGIWNQGKPYEACLRDLSSLISISLENEMFNKMENNLLSSLWVYWYFHIFLKINIMRNNKYICLAESFCLFQIKKTAITNCPLCYLLFWKLIFE